MSVPISEQDFCIYCQRQFTSPGRLAQHLRAKHPTTYAAVQLALEEEERREVPERDADMAHPDPAERAKAEAQLDTSGPGWPD